MSKGGISIPPYLVATMIAMVIIIAVAYLFLTETGKSMLNAFQELSTKTIRNFICGIIPIVGQLMCRG
jgi:hypothetical protein